MYQGSATLYYKDLKEGALFQIGICIHLAQVSVPDSLIMGVFIGFSLNIGGYDLAHRLQRLGGMNCSHRSWYSFQARNKYHSQLKALADCKGFFLDMKESMLEYSPRMKA